MNERLNRFTSLLKQIFELDKSDLDFGIYRVMNLRKAQIEEFLTERLPLTVLLQKHNTCSLRAGQQGRNPRQNEAN